MYPSATQQEFARAAGSNLGDFDDTLDHQPVALDPAWVVSPPEADLRQREEAVGVLPGKRYTVEDVLYLAWRWRLLIVLPWIIVAAATFVIVRRLPNVYRSESLIQVVPARVPEGYVRSSVTAREPGLREPVDCLQRLVRVDRLIQVKA